MEQDPLKTRDFICSCGKNYLSYAALFTHIKQKHDGKAPGPIVRPRSERKRGRPRKNPVLNENQDNSDSQQGSDNFNNSQTQTKKRQAAEMLGCGKFQAFKAYKPKQSQLPSRQQLPNPSFKRVTSTQQRVYKNDFPSQESQEQVANRDLSFSLNLVRAKSVPGREMDTCGSENILQFVIKNVRELYDGYVPLERQLGYDRIVDILDWIDDELKDRQYAYGQWRESGKDVSFEETLKCFIRELSPYLLPYQNKQLSFLFSLFHEYLSLNKNILINIQNSLQSIGTFLSQYLDNRVRELAIDYLHLMTGNCPLGAFGAFCNWLSVTGRRGATTDTSMAAGTESNLTVVKDERGGKRVNVDEYNKNYKGTKVYESSIQKQNSSDLKFEEINLEKIDADDGDDNLQEENGENMKYESIGSNGGKASNME